jgi:hypothetical protein
MDRAIQNMITGQNAGEGHSMSYVNSHPPPTAETGCSPTLDFVAFVGGEVARGTGLYCTSALYSFVAEAM